MFTSANPSVGAELEGRWALVDCFQQTFPALAVGDDGAGRRGLDEGLRRGVVDIEVATDRLVQLGHRAEDAALEAPLCDAGEQPLDGADPGRIVGVKRTWKRRWRTSQRFTGAVWKAA